MTLVPLLILAVSPILIDGSFEDWSEGQTESSDEYYLYRRVTSEEERCLQQLPDQYLMQLGDYDIVFSPKGKGYGVTCFSDGKEISPYDVGLVFSPTTSSTSFEVRINKATLAPSKLFTLTPQSKDTIRVVSWNVQFGQLLDQKDRGTRILQALKPDILLLQELDGDDTPELLGEFLQSSLGGSWHVYMSEGNGTERHHQLRSAIATKFKSIELTDVITPNKTVIANIEVQNKIIMFTSLHLRCCGGPNSEADQQRREEATVIRKAIDSIKSDGFVIAGDWNLVGTKKPLLTVQGNDFVTLEAFQPDGLLNATWSDVSSPFTPGRLDWMLVSKDAFTIERGFILDTSDLHSETLATNHLLSDDTAILSDHLPLVADLRIAR